MKWERILVVLAVALFFAALLPGESWASEPDVRVCLRERAQRLRFSCDTSWTIYDASGNPLQQVAAGQEVTMNPGGGRIEIEGYAAVASPVIIRSNEGHLKLEGRPYRGFFRVETQDDGLLAINIVPMEQYLYGVVPREMPASWPMEALKAQAVAARTYALRNMNQRSGARYDVVSTQLNQVYGGLSDEQRRASQAVDATRGQVITYNGAPILAAYHSSSGGHTENVENVWGYPLPYLVGVKDVDYDSPYYRWEVTYTFEGLRTYLDRANLGVGDVFEVRLSDDRGVSGRPVEVTVIGSQGSRTVRSDVFRRAVGLRSTKLDLEVGDATVQVPETRKAGRNEYVTIVGAASTDERPLTYNMVLGAGQEARRVLDATIAGAGFTAPVVLTFSGGGWGHGVGMSQYGARALAEEGRDYRAILTYYYTGVDLSEHYAR